MGGTELEKFVWDGLDLPNIALFTVIHLPDQKELIITIWLNEHDAAEWPLDIIGLNSYPPVDDGASF